LVLNFFLNCCCDFDFRDPIFFRSLFRRPPCFCTFRCRMVDVLRRFLSYPPVGFSLSPFYLPLSVPLKYRVRVFLLFPLLASPRQGPSIEGERWSLSRLRLSPSRRSFPPHTLNREVATSLPVSSLFPRLPFFPFFLVLHPFFCFRGFFQDNLIKPFPFFLRSCTTRSPRHPLYCSKAPRARVALSLDG